MRGVICGRTTALARALRATPRAQETRVSALPRTAIVLAGAQRGARLPWPARWPPALGAPGRSLRALAIDAAEAAPIANELAVPKLEDANLAGGPDAGTCTLIVTEGDSAKALAVSGLSIVGRDRYGVFPLRGKLLNVRDATPAQLSGNDTIVSLKAILGLQDGMEYMDVKSLRYGSLMIMTDQDHDGSHIKGLIINFLHAQFPSLLQVPGFLRVFNTPIVKATRGKTVESFYTLPQFEAWCAAQPGGSPRGWAIKYYKGLGTSTATEAKEYFSALAEHTKTFLWSGDADGKAIELAFAPERVTERKAWLRNAAAGTFLDQAAAEVPYSDFIHRELILFSLADLQRSLPHVMDGLKPSQRKVLHCAFKRGLNADVKVAQLAGYIGEHAAYHHGEQSLMATIVGLAQDFCGARNINLLVPSGQFGTRLAGGKDAASPRYIYTRLSPLARALFPAADDGLLEALEEDGQRIEPRFFLPVLPLLLINGADGIGTGWSTAVPAYNPRDVLAAVRAALDGKAPPALHPWFRGFTGSVAPVPPEEAAKSKAKGTQYNVDGVATQQDATTAVVTELPVGVWTADYRETLSAMVRAGTLLSFRDYSSDTRVRFEISVPAAALARVTRPSGIGLVRFLRLRSKLSTGNMHTFDAGGAGVQRFDSPAEVLAAFVPARLEAYRRRQQHAVAVLKDRAARLAAARAFLGALADGRVQLDGASDADVAAQLAKLALPRLPREELGAYGGPAHVAPDAASGPLAGWEYLLDIPHALRTETASAELAERAAAVATEAVAAEKATPEALWRADLDAFEAAYHAAEAEAAQLAIERDEAAAASAAAYAELQAKAGRA